MSPCQNLLLISVQYSYQVGFPVSYPYQVLLLLQSLYQQLLEVTSISTPYQLSSSPVIYFHEVIVPSSPITFCYQLFLSLSGIYFPDKVLVSGVPISYSSASTQFPYLKLLLYQLLLLPTVTVSLLHISCSGYSLLIPPSRGSRCERQSLLLITVSVRNYTSLPYKSVFSATIFRY